MRQKGFKKGDPPTPTSEALTKFGVLVGIIVAFVTIVFGVTYMLQSPRQATAKGTPASTSPDVGSVDKPKVGTRLQLELSSGDTPLGKIQVGLYDEVVPKTAENFKQLCLSQKKGFSLMGSKFHRIIKDFMIQGGDITNGDGTGGVSIYGKSFPDENHKIKHSIGVLSMANAGKDTNNSQFFITVAETAWLDGKHVVFGSIVDGMDLVRKVSKLPTKNDRPIKDIIISSCTEL